MTHSMHKKGFTFIELLVYIAIITVLLTMIISLYFALARSRQKQQSTMEVEQQGYAAMSILTQTIRNAQTVSTPSPTASSSSLALVTYTASTSPTVFRLTASSLEITEGSSTPVWLTSPQVVVSNLLFLNLAASTTEGSVRIQFTISHATTSDRYDTNYSTTFYGTATVRNIQ